MIVIKVAFTVYYYLMPQLNPITKIVEFIVKYFDIEIYNDTLQIIGKIKEKKRSDSPLSSVWIVLRAL